MFLWLAWRLPNNVQVIRTTHGLGLYQVANLQEEVMTTLYGFTVAVFLIINGGNAKLVVPFASMEACEAAREMMIVHLSNRNRKSFTCVETGVPGG